MTNSANIRNSPRVKRKLISSDFDLPRLIYKYAEVPARKTKTGAQKCVIQRVKKSAALVWVRSVGENLADEKNSRTWSSAMIIITMPRKTSKEIILGFFTSASFCMNKLNFYFKKLGSLAEAG